MGPRSLLKAEFVHYSSHQRTSQCHTSAEKVSTASSLFFRSTRLTWTSGMVFNSQFAEVFKVEVAAKILVNSSTFTIDEVIIQPLSAERGEKEQSLKLFFTLLASVRNAQIPLRCTVHRVAWRSFHMMNPPKVVPPPRS